MRKMLPINPREFQKQLRQLKKMGMKVNQLENVNEIIIRLGDKKIILENPEVMIIEFASQKMFYVMPKAIREEAEVKETIAPSLTIKDEDIQFIVEYTGVSYEVAKEMLIKAGGDIAKAIEIIEENKQK